MSFRQTVNRLGNIELFAEYAGETNAMPGRVRKPHGPYCNRNLTTLS